jgi:hypothetical protein
MDSRAHRLTLLCAMALSACARGPSVARVYGGTLVEGHYIEAPAYAAFLRASLADGAGDSRGAVDSYRQAARWDPEARDAMTAGGTVRCRLESCRTPAGSASKRGGRTALVATADDFARAWLAAETWALANEDIPLRVAALEALARLGPTRRDAAARSAEDLAGLGALGPAGSLAAAAVDASDEPLSTDWAVAARLAVDEAIARGEVWLVRQRATRSRVGLEEAAARALLAGRREVARSLALAETLADPSAMGARFVLAGAGGSDVMGLLDTPPVGARSMSGAEWVAYGQALQHVTTLETARSLLAGLGHDPILAGDDRVVRAAVDLASRGVIGAEALPSTGVVELAVVYDGALAGSPRRLAVDPSALDERHRYLTLARGAPSDPRTRELGQRLHGPSSDDPIVAAAAALVDLAEGARLESHRARRLLDRDPGDAVLASVALRVAERTGETETAKVARAVVALVVRPEPRVQ